MFLVKTQRAIDPYGMGVDDLRVHTLEGLTYELNRRPALRENVLGDDALWSWLDGCLGQKSLSTQLQSMKKMGESIEERLTLLLEATSFGKSLIQSQNTLSFKDKGDKAYLSRDYLQALRYYQSGLEKKKDWQLYNNAALCYVSLEYYEKAIKYLDQALSEGGDHQCLMNKVKIHSVMNAYEDMLKCLQEVGEGYLTDEVWYYYGVAYEGADKMEEALAAYAKSAEIGRIEAYGPMVRIAIVSGAVKYLTVWLSDHEVGLDGEVYLLGLMAKYKGRSVEFITAMEKLEDSHVFASLANSQLLDYYMENQQVIKGMEHLNIQSSQHHMDSQEVQLLRGILKYEAGDMSGYKEEVEALLMELKYKMRHIRMGRK